MKSFFKGLLMILVTGLALSTTRTFAGLASQVEIETALEKRVYNLVSRVDPQALVRVSVAIKKISAPLPGTNLEVKEFHGSSGALTDNGISSVSIVIYTSNKTGLPNWLKAEILKSVPEVRAKIAVKPLRNGAIVADKSNVDSAKMLDALQSILKAQNQQGFDKELPLRLGIAFGIAGLICISFASAVAYFLTKKQMYETSRIVESRLIPALQNISGQASESQASNRPTLLQATLTAPEGGFPDSGSSSATNSHARLDVADLSIATLETLFADCYWCHNDNYAAWLWGAMTPEQRRELFNSKKIEQNYLRLIPMLPKAAEDHHLDPSYLNPLTIQHLSQDDIARWVEGFLPGFHLLSPMRQLSLPINLKTRLACMSEPVTDKLKIPPIPERPSPKRLLMSTQKIAEMTPDDETTVLHNPAFVPEALRSELRSLVWLALKPFEYRQKILNDFTAEELASAWLGSPDVLARLYEALPEKKRGMLDGYLKSVETNKRAYVFKQLVEFGLKQEQDPDRLEEQKNMKAA